MALPSGMSVFTITFGSAGVLGEAEDLSMVVTFTASTNALWIATGQPFLFKPQVAAAPLGQSGSATLISPDQDGFQNGLGQSIRNWTYLAHIVYLDSTGAQIATADKSFAYLTSMGSIVDLDTTVPVTTSAGVIVDVPGAGGSYDGGTFWDPNAASNTSSSNTAVVGSATVGSSTVG